MYAFGRSEYEIKGGEIIYKDVGPIGVMVTEPNTNATTEPTLRDLKELLIAACGTDYGVHSPTWISRFTDMTRQAATYRSGRVLLAGDAAHVHSPIGGQGLSTGVQDAVNLGWKLAQVVKGTSPDSLLDTYHAERHPVGARVLKTTMAQVALHREDDRTLAVRDIVGELLKMEEPRKRIAGMMSGLDIRYELGQGHPLLGRRMPDLDVVTASGPRRVFSFLHNAQPVLLNLGCAERHRHRAVVRPRSVRRREIHWQVGTAGARRSRCACRGVDPPRRLCRLGRRQNTAGADGSADDLVRGADEMLRHVGVAP